MGGISVEIQIMKSLVYEKLKAKHFRQMEKIAKRPSQALCSKKEESHHGWSRLSKKEDCRMKMERQQGKSDLWDAERSLDLSLGETGRISRKESGYLIDLLKM